jgi:hypothetical protein
MPPAAAEPPPPPPPEWPEHFPEGCPDSNYPETNGAVFRLVRGDDGDYKTQYELGGFADQDECRRKALSVYNARQHAEYALTVYTRYSGIARADLITAHGRIKRTGQNRGHCSLWLRAEFDGNRAALFTVEP